MIFLLAVSVSVLITAASARGAVSGRRPPSNEQPASPLFFAHLCLFLFLFFVCLCTYCTVD